MRKRPSWTVRQNVAPVPASWAIATEEELEAIPLPAPPPASVPRLSLVPPPAAYSEADEMRITIADLRAALEAANTAMMAMQECHEAEKAELTAARERLIADFQNAVIRLATAIAERAVGVELKASPALIEEWSAEAVAILGGGERKGDEVSFEGRVVEVTPAARVAAVTSALEERKAA